MTKRKRIIVIGGSAAGPKAAAKARRIDNNAEVVILQKEADLSMASCGYPYYVGGYFNDRNQLLTTPAGVVRTPMFYLNAKDIDARSQYRSHSHRPEKPFRFVQEYCDRRNRLTDL